MYNLKSNDIRLNAIDAVKMYSYAVMVCKQKDCKNDITSFLFYHGDEKFTNLLRVNLRTVSSYTSPSLL